MTDTVATTPAHAQPPLDPRQFVSYRRILLLAGPLILSHMGVMLMQLVDALFLARYSTSAIAAIGPAGLSFWLICGLFLGLAGYSNTFVAQYIGAKRPDRVGAAVWQGIYLATLAGVIIFLASFAARPLFDAIGHDPTVRADEVTYFRISCYGGIAFVMSAAISGFFSGRHDTRPLLVAHILGGLTNVVLDYALIFGHFGLPGMGMAGAAWATVIGQAVQTLYLGALLFRPAFRQTYGTWRDRAIDSVLLRRMCIYGFPNGVRFVIEIAVWTVFLFLVGRINSLGLAASNIAWRINGLGFFPVVGLSIAVSMLVGQAQGAGRPDLARKATLRGLLLAEIWMAAAALCMVLFPHALLSLFLENTNADAAQLRDISTKLLWFVAAYCLTDGVNIIFMSMLAGAGDTRWLLIVSGALHLAFLAVLWIMSLLGATLYPMWIAATTFILAIAIVWVIRFRSGRWETKRVIEHAPPDIEPAAAPEASAAAVGKPSAS